MLDLILNNFDLYQIANSGQCFRMHEIHQNVYQTIAFNRILNIEALGNSVFRFYCDEDEFYQLWYEYFDLGTDYSEFIEKISSDDHYLTKAANYASGIRILKQEPWETLVSFIISQRKNIPAIKKSVELLCQKYGQEIGDNIFSFPTASTLSKLSIEELNMCSLGYRSKYIFNTAQSIDNGILRLNDLYHQSDMDILEKLCTLSGVGNKVANCIMLFAYHRINAFPIDVWIERVLKDEYNNQFNLLQYDGFAGVIQQYMFYYAQHIKKE